MKKLIKKLLREGLLNEDNINNLRKDLDFKLLSNKVYTQSEMVKLGGNYHLHHGMLMMIRLDDIDGLDPIPGGWNDDEGNYNDFVKGTKLSNKPIEVIYDLPNNVFYLYDGNHRVNQAKINGSKYIKAFVQADKDIYNNWRRKSLGEELINDSTEHYTQDEDDEHTIVRVIQDDYHEYRRCDGVLYELSTSGDDFIVSVDEIEHTEENQFYHDQIERYVKYIRNGGALESFPVQESQLGDAYNLEEMIQYLSESDNFDLMYDLVNVTDSKAYKSLYDVLDNLPYDSESYGIEDKLLSKIRNKTDLDKYYGSDYLESFDEEEIEDYSYYWEPEYYEGFKRILEHWADNKEYTLTDMNHRFSAIKELGIKSVYVDPS